MSFGNMLSGALESALSGGNNQQQNNQHYNNQNDGFSSALSHAQSFMNNHHNSDSNSGASSLFSSAVSHLSQNQQHLQNPQNYHVNEDEMVNAHQQLYGNNDNSNATHDSSTVGAGAAMQALKMFTSGQSGGSGMDQNAFIGMAMAQASKLFDNVQGSGAQVNGDKQSAVNSAAEMALKLYMKSQGQSGGAAGLMGLASKFF